MFNKNFSESLISAADNAAFCEVDNKIVLMNVDTGYYYGLDEVGKFIWDLLKQKPSLFKEIEAAVHEHYEIEASQITKDLSNLLTNLERAGLIQIRSVNKSR